MSYQKEEQDMIDLYNRNEFLYYYLSIIKNWVFQKSSKWNQLNETNKLDKNTEVPDQLDEAEFRFLIEEEEKNQQRQKVQRLKLINEALQHYLKVDPDFLFEANVFKLHYEKQMNSKEIQKH